nr:hypothetical protein [Tanacetum cinerariifolium]
MHLCLDCGLSNLLWLRFVKITFVVGIYHNANVVYVALICEDLQYQIDNHQSKIRRREIMPYPRFTKTIIHRFMTKHKSISTRQGSPYHTVNDDEVLDRLKFINKDIYYVYGKPILDSWITGEIKKYEAYKMYFKYSTSLIPLKEGRGRGAQGTKATDALKQINVVCKKKTDASKKKQSKRKWVHHNESEESEEEQKNWPTGRKKRTPRAVVIQEPPSVFIKKTQESSGNLKGIELLSDATQFEINTQKAMKASKRTSRFQHQIVGSSEGAGLRLEVPDEFQTNLQTQMKELVLHQRFQMSQKIKVKLDMILMIRALMMMRNIYLLTKIRNPKIYHGNRPMMMNIRMMMKKMMQVLILKTNDERTNGDDEDTVMCKAEKTVEQKADEEHEADKEKKGDEHVEDEQVVGIYHNANVVYVALICEDLQYQIDNHQSKIRRREIMPYPRFTKTIIHRFMTKHKSISTRQGSPYHTVNDDEVLDRLKFINKDIYYVYGKPILDSWITGEIKKYEAYKMYFKYSTSLIPLKEGRGRGAQGTKATDALKQINVVCKKKTDASKKKQSKRKWVHHNESEESEEEQKNWPTGRKKRTPRAVVIQEPPSVFIKKTQESSGNLKGIELLSDATQFEINTQKAMKASKRTSRFQHQIVGSSEGAGLRLEVPDEFQTNLQTQMKELIRNPKIYHGNRPMMMNMRMMMKKMMQVLILKTNDERTNGDDEDTVMCKAKKTVEQKADEEHEADKEKKGDEHVEDEQVVVHVSTTQKERPSLLQSTSSHSVSSNFGNQFINSPNASLIGTIPENAKAEINFLLDIQIQQDVPTIQQKPFHADKVSIIPKTTQQPPFTPPTPPLPATKNQSTQVLNTEAVKSVVEDLLNWNELSRNPSKMITLLLFLLQLDLKSHQGTTRISFKSLLKLMLFSEVKNFLPKFLPQAVKEALEKTPPSLANMKKGNKPNTIFKKRDQGDDQDKDLSVGSNQGKKTKKIRVNESESSKKTSTTKKQSKGKSLAKTSKSGKSVTVEEPVEEPVFEIGSDMLRKLLMMRFVMLVNYLILMIMKLKQMRL